jgi:hypothetical protein
LAAIEIASAELVRACVVPVRRMIVIDFIDMRAAPSNQKTIRASEGSCATP